MDIFDTNDPKKEIKNSDDLQNELDDIILNKKEKNFDIKKIALIGGSIILLLLIVISIMKIVSEKPKNESEDFFATEATPPKNEVVEESSFEQVPIIKEDTKEPEEKFDKLAQDVIKEEKSKEEIVKTPVQKPIATKKITEEKPNKLSKKETLKPKIKEKRKVAVSKKYYIQVGAFYRLAPSKKFLKSIEKNGFNYVIKTVIKDSSEIKKILIGPFASRDEAKTALPKIKKTIKKDAFITRVK